MSDNFPDTLIPEFPDHSLFSPTPLKKSRCYEHNGNRLKICPSHVGSASMDDRELLTFFIAKYLENLTSGRSDSPKVSLTGLELTCVTKKYPADNLREELDNALTRLQGTIFETDIKGVEFSVESSRRLLSQSGFVAECEREKVSEVEIVLTGWLCDAILNENKIEKNNLSSNIGSEEIN